MTEPPDSATRCLVDHGEGDEEAENRLVALLYDQLREMARARFRAERKNHTLQPTAVVHEVYLRLIDDTRVDQKSRAEFLAMAARTLRQVLVDHARSHRAVKRGGEVHRVTLDEGVLGVRSNGIDVLALDEAMSRLGEINQRQVRVIEMRFFGGLTERETAGALGVSERTVRADWELARAWLARELTE